MNSYNMLSKNIYIYLFFILKELKELEEKGKLNLN
jgi:hypothetical protein